MIRKINLWHRSQKGLTARGSSRAWFWGCVIALGPFESILGQPSATERLQDRDAAWGAWDRRGSHIEREETPFDRPGGVIARPQSSLTVTLHGLTHRVPGRAVKEYERGVKAANKGENENAIEYYKKAIAADPEFVSAMNDLGVAYLQADTIELAIEQFTKARAVDPHAAKPNVNLAIAWLRKGNFVDAEDAARRAVNLNPADTYAPLILGASLVLKGKVTPEAEHSLRKAAKDHVVAKLWLAFWLIKKGDVATAKEHLRTYIAQANNDPSNFAAELLEDLEAVGQTDGFLAKREN
jgi:Flp pilus assembly protein TadD